MTSLLSLLSRHPHGTAVILDAAGAMIATVDSQGVRRDRKGRVLDPEPQPERHHGPPPGYTARTRKKSAPLPWREE